VLSEFLKGCGGNHARRLTAGHRPSGADHPLHHEGHIELDPASTFERQARSCAGHETDGFRIGGKEDDSDGAGPCSARCSISATWPRSCAVPHRTWSARSTRRTVGRPSSPMQATILTFIDPAVRQALYASHSVGGPNPLTREAVGGQLLAVGGDHRSSAVRRAMRQHRPR